MDLTPRTVAMLAQRVGSQADSLNEIVNGITGPCAAAWAAELRAVRAGLASIGTDATSIEGAAVNLERTEE